MSNVVSIIDGQALTTSIAIAKGAEYEHSTVIRLVRDNKSDLEEFGLLDFRSESTGGRPTRYALLNEQQSTLLMTYMRNNDVVRLFKKTLVKAFFELTQKSKVRLPDFSDPVQAARAWADEKERCNVLVLESKAKDEKIEKLENFFQSGMTITAFGKMLNGVNCTQMNNYCLNELDWIYNESRSGKNRRFRAKSKARDRYLTETNKTIGLHGAEPFTKNEPKLLQDGAKKLYQLYLDGELPMKKTWNGEFSHIKFLAEAS